MSPKPRYNANVEMFVRKSSKVVVYFFLVLAGAILVLLGSSDKRRAMNERMQGSPLSFLAEEAHADAPGCAACSACSSCSCGDGMPDADCSGDSADCGSGDGDGDDDGCV